MQTLKRVLHSLSCGKFKVLKRIAAGASSEPSGEKEKGAGGLIKPTDSFIFNAAFRYLYHIVRTLLHITSCNRYPTWMTEN